MLNDSQQFGEFYFKLRSYQDQIVYNGCDLATYERRCSPDCISANDSFSCTMPNSNR